MTVRRPRFRKVYTREAVREIPSPDDASGEEGDDENETVDKLEFGTRHLKFVLKVRYP